MRKHSLVQPSLLVSSCSRLGKCARLSAGCPRKVAPIAITALQGMPRSQAGVERKHLIGAFMTAKRSKADESYPLVLRSRSRATYGWPCPLAPRTLERHGRNRSSQTLSLRRRNSTTPRLSATWRLPRPNDFRQPGSKFLFRTKRRAKFPHRQSPVGGQTFAAPTSNEMPQGPSRASTCQSTQVGGLRILS